MSNLNSAILCALRGQAFDFLGGHQGSHESRRKINIRKVNINDDYFRLLGIQLPFFTVGYWIPNCSR